jgi:hypothetical protein
MKRQALWNDLQAKMSGKRTRNDAMSGRNAMSQKEVRIECPSRDNSATAGVRARHQANI